MLQSMAAVLLPKLTSDAIGLEKPVALKAFHELETVTGMCFKIASQCVSGALDRTSAINLIQQNWNSAKVTFYETEGLELDAANDLLADVAKELEPALVEALGVQITL